jgi:hypothetical protein
MTWWGSCQPDSKLSAQIYPDLRMKIHNLIKGMTIENEGLQEIRCHYVGFICGEMAEKGELTHNIPFAQGICILLSIGPLLCKDIDLAVCDDIERQDLLPFTDEDIT